MNELKVIYNDWINCTRCQLGHLAFKHCLWDTIPEGLDKVDILMCGEGPGNGEDSTGKPFKGPAGRLLKKAMGLADPGELTVGFTNLVACKPQDRKGAAFRPPTSLEIETCQPRLSATILAFDPICLVALGRLPDEWLSSQIGDEKIGDNYFRIPHPSSILRQGGEDAPKRYPDYTHSAWDDYIEMFEVLFQRTRELKNPTIALFKPPVGRV